MVKQINGTVTCLLLDMRYNQFVELHHMFHHTLTVEQNNVLISLISQKAGTQTSCC